MLNTLKSCILGMLIPLPTSKQVKDQVFSRSYRGLTLTAESQPSSMSYDNLLPYGIYPRWIVSYIATALHLSKSTLKIEYDHKNENHCLFLPQTLRELNSLFGVKNLRTRHEIRKQWSRLWSTKFSVTLGEKSKWLQSAWVREETNFVLFRSPTHFHANGLPACVPLSEQFATSLLTHYLVFDSKVQRVKGCHPVLWDLFVWCASRSGVRENVTLAWNEIAERFLNKCVSYKNKTEAVHKTGDFLDRLQNLGCVKSWSYAKGRFTLSLRRNVTNFKPSKSKALA